MSDEYNEDSDEIKDLKNQLATANLKWSYYEEHYILPCFKWAEGIGYDLKAAVRDNAGRNCVDLFVAELMRRFNSILKEYEDAKLTESKRRAELHSLLTRLTSVWRDHTVKGRSFELGRKDYKDMLHDIETELMSHLSMKGIQ